MTTPQPEAIPMPDVPDFHDASVGQEVREYVRHLIMTGRLRTDDRLRVEHIAAQLKISVTPVREALVELMGEGFVNRRRRRGYVVSKLTRSGFEDRVLVLAMVTGELAFRAASLVDVATLANLDAMQKDLRVHDSAGERDIAETLNHRVHSTINLAAKSPELAWTAERFSRYLPRYSGLEWTARPRTCTYEHGPIFEALRAKDADGARATMFDHLVESTKQLADDLERAGLWQD